MQTLNTRIISLNHNNKMESQKNIQANILIQVDNVLMHRLVTKQKTLYTSGVLKVAKIDSAHDSPVYFLNINSFYYTLSKSVVITKIEYDDTVSYVFSHFDNGLSSISLLKKEDIIHNFDEIIRNIAVLNQYKTSIENEQFKRNIDEHCPKVSQQAIYCPDKIKSTITTAGKKLQGGIVWASECLTSGIHKVGQIIQSKIEQPQTKSQVSPAIKEKWQTLKLGTNKIFTMSKQLYLKYLAPWVNTGLQYGKQISEKIENSDNHTAKYVKSIACTSGNVVCSTFKGITDSTNKVITQLGCQSRKIIKKRLGDDYVKTFLPEESKEGNTQKSLQNLKQKECDKQNCQ